MVANSKKEWWSFDLGWPTVRMCKLTTFHWQRMSACPRSIWGRFRHALMALAHFPAKSQSCFRVRTVIARVVCNWSLAIMKDSLMPVPLCHWYQNDCPDLALVIWQLWLSTAIIIDGFETIPPKRNTKTPFRCNEKIRRVYAPPPPSIFLPFFILTKDDPHVRP